MTIAVHACRLAVVLVLLAAPRAQAVPLGIFDEAVHDHVEIVFEFAPFTPSGLLHLGLGLASSLVPPSPGYAGCNFTLSVGGSQVSSVLHPNIFGCQGWWTSGDGTGVSDVIDTFVNLSGLAAGQVGTIRMRPTFLGPGGIASLDSPSIHFGGSVTILSQTIVPLPEPSIMLLAASGFLAAAMKQRSG